MRSLLGLSTILIVIVLLHVQFATAEPAEWQKVTGPWSGVCDSSLGTLAFHPGDAKTLYVGTTHLTEGCGIFKTTDEGQTWKAVNNGLTQIGLFTKHYPAISKITISPSNPNILYVGVTTNLSPPFLGGGIFKSTNGGEEWIDVSGKRLGIFKLIDVPVLGVAINPEDPNMVLASTEAEGVYKTQDGGETWSQVKTGAPPPVGVIDYYHIVQYASTYPYHLFLSGFTLLSGFLPLCTFSDAGVPSADCLEAQGITPLGLERSTDSGETWEETGLGFGSVLITDLATHPSNNSILYASTMGTVNLFIVIPICNPARGILKSIDGGKTWRPVNNGIPKRPTLPFPGTCPSEEYIPIISLAVDSTNPDRLYAAAGDRGIFYSSNGGRSWEQLTDTGMPDSPFVSKVYVNPNGTRLYASTFSGLFWLDISEQPPPTGTPVDIYLLVDLSGSFIDDLPHFKTQAPGIINTLKAIYPNIRFGLGKFEDYPISPFGNAGRGDKAYERLVDLTFDTETVLNTIEGLFTRSGADGPQSQLPALYQTATGEGQDLSGVGYPDASIPPGQQANFRDGATKIILLWTDAPFHRPGDPGDIPYPGPSFLQTIAALLSGGIIPIPAAASSTVVSTTSDLGNAIKVIGISSGTWAIPDLKEIAEGTGNLAPPEGVDCDADGVIDIPAGEPIVCEIAPTGEGIAEAIIATVEAVAKFEYSDLQVSPTEVGPGQEVQASATVRNVGTSAGTETVNLLVDGVIRDTQELTLDPGESQVVEFSFTFAEAEIGDHEVTINGLAPVTVTVVPRVIPPRTATAGARNFIVQSFFIRDRGDQPHPTDLEQICVTKTGASTLPDRYIHQLKLFHDTGVIGMLESGTDALLGISRRPTLNPDVELQSTCFGREGRLLYSIPNGATEYFLLAVDFGFDAPDLLTLQTMVVLIPQESLEGGSDYSDDFEAGGEFDVGPMITIDNTEKTDTGAQVIPEPNDAEVELGGTEAIIGQFQIEDYGGDGYPTLVEHVTLLLSGKRGTEPDLALLEGIRSIYIYKESGDTPPGLQRGDRLIGRLPRPTQLGELVTLNDEEQLLLTFGRRGRTLLHIPDGGTERIYVVAELGQDFQNGDEINLEVIIGARDLGGQYSSAFDIAPGESIPAFNPVILTIPPPAIVIPEITISTSGKLIVSMENIPAPGLGSLQATFIYDPLVADVALNPLGEPKVRALGNYEVTAANLGATGLDVIVTLRPRRRAATGDFELLEIEFEALGEMGEETEVKVDPWTLAAKDTAGQDLVLDIDPGKIQIQLIKGDVNFDGIVTRHDAREVAKFIVGRSSLTWTQLRQKAADVVGPFCETYPTNSTRAPACIDASDVRAIMLAAYGVITLELQPLQVEAVTVSQNSNGLSFKVKGQGITSTQLQVYNLAGQEVFNSGQVKGATFEWNLMNNRGEVVANGVYLYIVTTRGYDGQVIKSEVRKLVILK